MSTSTYSVTPAPKVVVLRGPPGAGKSTVSSALLAKLRAENGPNRKVAYIEQDYFRKGILGRPGADAIVASKIMEGAIHSATEAGYDCLCEGMLTLPKHGPFIDRLRMKYRAGFLLVYLTVDLGETLKRHAGREKAKYIPSNKIVEWNKLCQPLGLSCEMVIQNNSLETTVEQIIEAMALDGPEPALKRANCDSD